VERNQKPSLRIRDCAQELGVSEAELLATTVGDYTIKLEGDWTKLVERLPDLGRVMSLTRNEGCVLEHKGPFQKVEIMGPPAHRMATVIGPIETRVFLRPGNLVLLFASKLHMGYSKAFRFLMKPVML
ncbi:MAG: heme ABC transporter, partial [Bacteroidetes bacterium OLB12]